MAMFHSAHANENRQIVTALIDGTVSTFDPYDANDTLSQSVAKSVYEGLFRLDENHNIQPVLALDWEVSEDGLTYTINLRRNVFFHDGTRFTANPYGLHLSVQPMKKSSSSVSRSLKISGSLRLYITIASAFIYAQRIRHSSIT